MLRSFHNREIPSSVGYNYTNNAPDKEYSLTDCISMNAMRRESVNKILTNDHHFAQEEFVVLMHRKQEKS